MEEENTILENPLYEAIMRNKVDYHTVNRELEQRNAILQEKENALNQEMARMVKNYLSLLGGGFDYVAKGVRRSNDIGYYDTIISWDIPKGKLQIFSNDMMTSDGRELAKHIYNPQFGSKIMEKFSSLVLQYLENNPIDRSIYSTLSDIISRPLPTLDTLTGKKIKLPTGVIFNTRDDNYWMDAFKIEPKGALWEITIYYGSKTLVLPRSRRWTTLEKEFEQVYEECRSYISKKTNW